MTTQPNRPQAPRTTASGLATALRPSRITHASRGTVSRVPLSAFRFSPSAFTLIELLIVIAVMAILASLVIPITGAVNKQKIRSRAKGEMNQLESGIDAYKAKYGFYPPDNPGYPAMNQLFYELMGTIPTNNPTTAGGSAYVTLDGSTRIVNVTAAFSGVTGFMNCSRGGGGDEAKSAKNFLASGLKPGQYMALASPPNPVVCTVLGSSLDGPLTYPGSPSGKINPWRYVSTNPTNNPNSYDLWIDVLVGGKTNRICNWSTEPLIL